MALALSPVGDPASYRAELAAYCRWRLGSPFDAEDAVQETLLRAWRGADGFQGRGPLKAWLYRIATNVCLDMIARRSRQPVPVAECPEQASDCADDAPVERALTREDRRLALIVAVQTLSPRQRAVLLLRDVLCLRAAEVAELLGITVAAVNSALQRARAGLGTADPEQLSPILDGSGAQVLARYAAAFDAEDLDALARLASAELEPRPEAVSGALLAA
jgi:RNA polymerase sigma-70 factor, ECF subfamily